jgi:hypothetical protein
MTLQEGVKIVPNDWNPMHVRDAPMSADDQRPKTSHIFSWSARY